MLNQILYLQGKSPGAFWGMAGSAGVVRSGRPSPWTVGRVPKIMAFRSDLARKAFAPWPRSAASRRPSYPSKNQQQQDACGQGTEKRACHDQQQGHHSTSPFRAPTHLLSPSMPPSGPAAQLRPYHHPSRGQNPWSRARGVAPSAGQRPCQQERLLPASTLPVDRMS